MERTLANDALNSLTAHVAVLDAQGFIVLVNDAWKRFARENGVIGDNFYVGASYLAVCEDAIVRGADGSAAAICQNLHTLMRGDGDSFSLEYPCHSETEKRWFVVRMTRFIRDNNTYLVVAHENITARKQAEDTLRETENLLREVLELLPVGVWIMNREGMIVQGNPAGKRIWAGARYVGPEQFGEYKGWWLSTGQRIAVDEWAAVRAITKGETSIDEEIRIECFDGTSKIILNSALPLRDAEQKIMGAIIVNQDITSRYRAEEELRHAKESIEIANRELQEALVREQALARTDGLTGINNRRHFFDLATSGFAVAQRYDNPLSILLLDIDHFKKINDTFGHQVGDAILKLLSTVACEHLRDADVIARYGGEEFIVLLPNTSAQGAYIVAENIRNGIARRSINTDKGYASVTVSAGIAEISSKEDTLDHLIRCADQALYIAKAKGRNRTEVSSLIPA